MATAAKLQVEIGADIRGFTSAMGKLENQLKNAGKSLQSAGRNLTLGVTAPILGIGAAAIKAASDVQEMQSKFNTVFKNVGGDVKNDLNKFASAVGRSRYELQGMAAQLGDIFKPLGFTEAEAGRLSVRMTKLAVDLGSFNNMPMSEALERLQGTLVGSHENALRFGVTINENVLKQELLRMGAEKLTGAQKEQAKVQARLNLLLAGTTDAQGDAIRTAGSFANQWERLRNNLKDLGVTIGKVVLPVATELVTNISGIVEGLAGMSTESKKTGLKLAGLVAAAGPLLWITGGLARALAAVGKALKVIISLANPYVLAAAAVAAIGRFVYLNWELVAEVIERNVLAFKNLAESLGNVVLTGVSGLKDWFADWLVTGTQDFDTQVADRVKQALLDGVGQAVLDFGGLKPGEDVDIDWNIIPLDSILDAALPESLKTFMEELKGAAAGPLVDDDDSVKKKAEEAAGGIKSVGTAALDLSLVDPDLAKMIGKFTGDTDSVVSATDDTTDAIGAVSAEITGLEGVTPDFSNVTSAIDTIEASAKGVNTALLNTVPDTLEVPDWIEDIVPTTDENARWSMFVSKMGEMQANLNSARHHASLFKIHLGNIEGGWKALTGHDSPQWMKDLVGYAADAGKIVDALASMNGLMQPELWSNVWNTLKTFGGHLKDIVGWIGKIIIKIGEWALAQLGITGVNAATGGGGGAGGVVSTGAGLAGSSGLGSTLGWGGVAGAATVAGGLLGIGAFGAGMNWLGGFTGSTLESNGFDPTTYGGGNLAGAFGGNLGAGVTGLNFGSGWLSGAQFGGGAGRMAQTINVVLDGQTIATSSLPYMAQELEVRGTNY